MSDQDRKLRAHLNEAFDAAERGDLTLQTLRLIVLMATFPRTISKEGQTWGMHMVEKMNRYNKKRGIPPIK